MKNNLYICIMIELKGKIIFDVLDVTKKHLKQSEWKKVVIAKIEGDIVKYYNWFLQKRFGLVLNKPLRGAHITIVNDRMTEEQYDLGRIYDNKELTFLYDPNDIRGNDNGHWWINVKCDEVAIIRETMKLEPIPYFRLHLTLGKANELNIEHSKYILRQCIKFNL